jgi:hypothetical protein
MVEHFRTALRAAVAAADAWMDSPERARWSKSYADMEAACNAVALPASDARRMLAALDHMEALTQRRMIAGMYWRAGDQRERARRHFPGSSTWRHFMGEHSACLDAAKAMEAPHV